MRRVSLSELKYPIVILNIVLEYLKDSKYHIEWIIDRPISLNNYMMYCYDNLLNSSYINEEIIYITKISRYRYRKYFRYNFIYKI